MSLFLTNEWNFISISKTVPSSTNIEETNILTALQNFFIHETQDDMIIVTNNTELIPQNHYLVYDALNDTVESLRSTVFSPSSSSPFIWYGRGNVEPFELVITRSSLFSCMS